MEAIVKHWSFINEPLPMLRMPIFSLLSHNAVTRLQLILLVYVLFGV